MKKFIGLLAAAALVFTFSSAAFAVNLSTASVNYDSRYFPELVYGDGGAEGNSGAYIQIIAGVDDFDPSDKINIRAKHMESDFEVTLVEASPDCAGVWPDGWNVDQFFGIRLKPYGWMTGTWEIRMKYKEGGSGPWIEESKTVVVPRFNSPPEPTGIQVIHDDEGQWLVWNSIGAPGSGRNKHIEYRVMHQVGHTLCVDKAITVRDYIPNYELLAGNKIAVRIPYDWWQPGDLIRIDNRVYDDNDGVFRMDRGVRYFFLQ